MESYLLACKQLFGSHNAENIFAEYEDVIDEFDIELEVFKVVTDSASNMKKAFQVSLPEFALDSEEEDEDDGAADIEESLESSEISEDIFDTVPERISCFAHTLQLSINNSINPLRAATAFMRTHWIISLRGRRIYAFLLHNSLYFF